jgi:hypothetical protein
MSNKFMNVHTFDGKLKDIFIPSNKHTVDEKRESFTYLIGCLTNPTAVTTVRTMFNDLSVIKGGNYQQENNIDSSDILMELIKWIDNSCVLSVLNEQLADATNLGICPSGRVTRLLQLWTAFRPREEKEEKEEKDNIV